MTRAAFFLAHWLRRLSFFLDDRARARSIAQHPARKQWCTFHQFSHPFDGVSDGAGCHAAWPIDFDGRWREIVTRYER